MSLNEEEYVCDITGINHITFATKDLDKSFHFYHQVLGIPWLARWQTGAYLLAGELWLCLSVDEKTKPCPHPEYTHIAFSIREAEFSNVKQRIDDCGITQWKVNTSEGLSLYILDPDNNKLELHVSCWRDRLRHMQEHPYQGMILNPAYEY